MEPNPYQPPLEAELPAHPVCNFCGQSPNGGPLVQAPGQEVYICETCARIAGGEIEQYKSQSWPLALISLTLGLGLLALLAANWFVWDDESNIGWGVSLLGGLCGVSLVSHFVAAMRARWHRGRGP